MDDTRAKDLDETRRLLYMVLFDGLASDRWHNLAGTLTNALAHHSRLAPADEAMDKLWAIRDAPAGPNSEPMRWVRSLIDQINEELAEPGRVT